MAPEPIPRRSRPAHQARSARRQATILDAVVRLLERGGSVSTITIDEICAEADVSRSSFYLRWSSKEALWTDLCAAYLEDAVEVVGRTRIELEDVDDLHAFAERLGVAYAAWMFDRRPEAMAFAELAEQIPDVGESMRRFSAMMMDAVGAEVARRLSIERPDLPAPAQRDMTRLVEVLLAAVQRALSRVRVTGELGAMSRDEFFEWFASISREMASMVESSVRDVEGPRVP